LFNSTDRTRFLITTALPLFVVAIILNGVCAGLLYWSTSKADNASIERQIALADRVISKLLSNFSNQQESVTFWDDAVRALQDPGANSEWIDVNLGVWMYTYFGHDAAFVVSPDGEPVYGSADGKRIDPTTFQAVSSEIGYLIKDLQTRLAAGDQTGVSDRVLTPGAADILTVNGRPAAASIKPIVSDTDDIEIAPGRQHLHVALRFLDGSLLQELREDFLLDGLRFAWSDASASTETASALRSMSGKIVGYFIWTPSRPGTAVWQHMLPMLVVLGAVSMGGLALILMVLGKRSLKLSQSQERVRHLAAHDLLTNLPNRSQFDRELNHALADTRSIGDKVALLYLDLDRFKHVNDTLGHRAGDEVLREFSSRLRTLAEPHSIARLSGDEFAMILRGVYADADIQRFCRRIIDSASKPFRVAGTEAFVGTSIGVALSPRDGTDRIELARRADLALYRAKATGRSCFAIFTPEMEETFNDRRVLENDFRLALTDPGALQILYQPVFDSKERALMGAEALLRWHHPSRGMILPDVFIPLAEEAGLIGRVGELVLRQAIAAAVAWPLETIAVNVSAVELRNPGYAARVASILLEFGLEPSRLELEVTETALADTLGHCIGNVAALRELGVRFALDDFGIGFSSLARLQTLDVDRIKIDRSFVSGFGSDSGDEAIVQAIINLAKATGLETTAEGVETLEQASSLQLMGCNHLQGFVFARPLPRAEFDALLIEHGINFRRLQRAHSPSPIELD
jgi:diguanylate cyclase (GGDEF)-like protein